MRTLLYLPVQGQAGVTERESGQAAGHRRRRRLGRLDGAGRQHAADAGLRRLSAHARPWPEYGGLYGGHHALSRRTGRRGPVRQRHGCARRRNAGALRLQHRARRVLPAGKRRAAACGRGADAHGRGQRVGTEDRRRLCQRCASAKRAGRRRGHDQGRRAAHGRESGARFDRGHGGQHGRAFSAVYGQRDAGLCVPRRGGGAAFELDGRRGYALRRGEGQKHQYVPESAGRVRLRRAAALDGDARSRLPTAPRLSPRRSGTACPTRASSSPCRTAPERRRCPIGARRATATTFC